jgi:hypothetical protein
LLTNIEVKHFALGKGKVAADLRAKTPDRSDGMGRAFSHGVSALRSSGDDLILAGFSHRILLLCVDARIANCASQATASEGRCNERNSESVHSLILKRPTCLFYIPGC